ncbi:MAG: hypothetical protein V1772_07925, partial [Chloroflexota bacterium]
MRIVLHGRSDDELRFAAQLGVDGIVSGFPGSETPHGTYEYRRIVALKNRVEDAGLRLEGLALLPWHLCYKWMLGLPGRD